MSLLKVYRRYLDGYTDSLHPRLPVGAADLPYAVSSSAHSAAVVVVPGAAVALAEKHSLVEAQQIVNIIMQQQHMSQSAVGSESMRGVEEETGNGSKGSAAPASVRSISIASLQPKFQLLRSPPTELKQHFDL
jgi:hypothetical protein